MTETMQTHYEPEPGQIWRHFKGGTYKIIGVSTVVDQSAIDCAIANQLVPYCYAIDTEQPCSTAIGVFKMASGELWCFMPTEYGCAEMGLRMVIYHPVDCPQQIWARPLNHFLAPTEDGRSRFELVAVQPQCECDRCQHYRRRLKECPEVARHLVSCSRNCLQ